MLTVMSLSDIAKVCAANTNYGIVTMPRCKKSTIQGLITKTDTNTYQF